MYTKEAATAIERAKTYNAWELKSTQTVISVKAVNLPVVDLATLTEEQAKEHALFQSAVTESIRRHKTNAILMAILRRIPAAANTEMQLHPGTMTDCLHQVLEWIITVQERARLGLDVSDMVPSQMEADGLPTATLLSLAGQTKYHLHNEQDETKPSMDNAMEILAASEASSSSTTDPSESQKKRRRTQNVKHQIVINDNVPEALQQTFEAMINKV
jgi:hypothetical protein